MNILTELTNELKRFRDDREWEPFHDSKNLAIALSIEASELNELFLWKTVAESEQVDKKRIKEELADVFAYALLLAERYGFDVQEIIRDKIKLNAEKYPVKKAKGNAKKYTEFDNETTA